jgi:hypothetical protein
VASTQERRWPVGWIVIAAMLILWFLAAQSDDAPASPTYNPPSYSGAGTYTSDPGDAGMTEFDSPGTYYENPAPGDDGSSDCPPGGGPVVVAPGDPAGLDGDGDGIGCE